MMGKEKAGEVVRLVAEQEDAEGFILSRLRYETFGYDNDTANAMSMALVETNLAGIEGIRVAKEGGVSAAEAIAAVRGKGKQNPGAIR